MKTIEKTYEVVRASGLPPAVANLRGTVTDANTGSPLAGVTVALDSYSVMTGADGSYGYAVPAGTYTIHFSKSGYQSLERQIVLIEGDNFLDVALSPSVIDQILPLLLVVMMMGMMTTMEGGEGMM